MKYPAINDELLTSKLEKLSSGPAIERLRARIRAGDDRQLFRINPYAFAAEEGVEPTQAIELLLRASVFGVFRTEWSLMCRGCGEYVVTHGGLRDLESMVHCLSCARDREPNLEETVEVAFTVDPEIRAIRFEKPETLDLADYFYNYKFSSNIHVRGEGRSLIDHLRLGEKALVRLGPGESHTFETNVDVGWIVGSPRMMITIEGEPTTEVRELDLSFDGRAFTPRPKVAPGPIRVTLRNDTTESVPVLSYFTAVVTYFDYSPFLSGQRLLNTNDFRRHIRTEVVRPGSAIASGSNTLLFSDLRGSTALYDRIGDKAAFELVSAHLELLARVVTRHSGIVVKTIGYAVMASFSRPVDAVRGAIEMNELVKGITADEPLVLKIGLHRGPCLVVNVREDIDYFGQTVNLAARVQSAAKSGEICMTEAIFDDPSVRALFPEPKNIPSESIALRGVGAPYLVYRFEP